MEPKILPLECKLRFSTDMTMESLRTLYVDNLTMIGQQCPAVMETANPNTTKMKKTLTKEASDLTADSDPTIARLGRAALNFLTIGALAFTQLMEVIAGLLVIGGILLVKCISFIERIIMYAAYVLPNGVVLGGLMLVENALGKLYNHTKDEHTKRYVTLSERLKVALNKKAVTEAVSKPSRLRSKSALQSEATKLSKHKDPNVAKLGRAAINFLKIETTWFLQLMEVIAATFMVGGAVVTVCITFIIGIVLYAVTVLPISTILMGLQLVEQVLGNTYSLNENKEIRKFVVLSEGIKRNASGVADIRTLDQLLDTADQVYESMLTDLENGFNWYSNTTMNILENAMTHFNPHKTDVLEKLLIYQDLAPSHSVATLESVSPFFSFEEDVTYEKSFELLEQCVSQPMLTGDSLLHGTLCLVSDVCEKTTLAKFLSCYKETAKYEFLHENYKDLPIIAASKIVLEYCQNCWTEHDVMLEQVKSIDKIYGALITEAYNEVKEDTVVQTMDVGGSAGFNPNPYNVYDLTPFPIASRKIADTLANIDFAETDEEIQEALLELGRITTIINENYYIDNVDGADIIVEARGHGARTIEDKTNRKFSKFAVKDKSKTATTAVKRTIDPMEKFINAQYTKIKNADKEERRKIIMKGGTLPKVWRWIKRGILLLAGATVGTKISSVALITGITFVGWVASDKYLDRRERTKILQEIEDEIQICNEKIDDSRGDDNKQKKYELMRIRNNLKRTQDKIRYGLRY